MSLMPASCHLARCLCKVYLNTEAINFYQSLAFFPIYCGRHDFVQRILIHF